MQEGAREGDVESIDFAARSSNPMIAIETSRAETKNVFP